MLRCLSLKLIVTSTSRKSRRAHKFNSIDMPTVMLAVYDLSRGLAAAMSQAILGEQLEGIWHTGVVVYSKEYFFGGGIQSLPEGRFGQVNGMLPLRMEHIGETTKTQEELETYLLSIRSRFTAATYNLLTHNCNNFSDELSKFLTGRGIPDYIISLPQRAFSTPGGQALRPFFEGMQAQISGMSGGADPFSHMGGAGNSPSSLAPALALAPSRSPASAPATTGPLSRPRLEEHALLSIDASAVKVLGDKILRSPECAMTESEKALLESAIAGIQGGSPHDVPLTGGLFSLLHRVLTIPGCQMAGFFILRLLVTAEKLPTEAFQLKMFVIDMLHSGSSSPEAVPPLFQSKAALVLGLCTLANWLNHDRFGELGDGKLERLVDASTRSLSSPHVEVRQMSSALIYNITILATKDYTLCPSWVSDEGVHHLVVQLLCASLDGVHEDADPTTRERRLGIAYRLIYVHGKGSENACAQLAKDIGFKEAVENLRPRTEKEEVLTANLSFMLK